MARLGYDSHAESMTIIVVDIPWGIAHIDVIKEGFEELGGNVISSYSYIQAEMDHDTLLDNIITDNPDILAVVGFEELGHLFQ